MKRALGWVVNIILIWLLIIVVTLFLLPRFGGWRFDSILSGSMEPALPLGGVVCIKPVEPSDISLGDIIAYRSGKALVTHRVVDVIGGGEPSFVTKGDANQDPDLSPVTATNLVGKVVFDMPYLGYVAAFIKTRLGFLLTIFLPGLAIIGLELKNLWQAVLKEDRAKAKPKAEVVPPLKTYKAPAAVDNHPEVAAFGRSSLINKLAIGIVIGAAVVIIVILAIAFLTEVL